MVQHSVNCKNSATSHYSGGTVDRHSRRIYQLRRGDLVWLYSGDCRSLINFVIFRKGVAEILDFGQTLFLGSRMRGQTFGYDAYYPLHKPSKLRNASSASYE